MIIINKRIKHVLTKMTQPRAYWTTFKLKVAGAVSRALLDKLTEDGISVMDFGAKGDGVTIDNAAFVLTATYSKKIIVPEGKTFLLSEYISLSNNHTVIINGTIVNKHMPTNTVPMYHVGGFDAEEKDNITITGTGTLSSEAILPQAESTFSITQNAGYCPIIHLRSCTNSRVFGLRLHKLAVGIAVTKFDEASNPDWTMGTLTTNGYNVDVSFITASYVAFFSVTLNSVYQGSIHHCRVHRSGDSGIHTQFSHFISISDNIRTSPYGDGGDYNDSVATGLLTVNDCQGMSIENCHSCLVANNIVRGLATNPIDVKNTCTDILVTGNTIEDSQLSGIAARGGDVQYGLNTSITIVGNTIKNTGYKHSSNAIWKNHPYRGAIFVDDTYSAFVKGNTITGLNTEYALAPIVARGLTLTDLGFWASSPVQERVSYTEIVIEGNSVTFPEKRSNYPDDPTNFEFIDCTGSGIIVTGIWGKIKVNNNDLLGNGFSPSIGSTTLEDAAISIKPAGASTGGEASAQSVSVNDNTITYWRCGGIYIDGENNAFDPHTVVKVGDNSVLRCQSYAMYLNQVQTQSITGNTVSAACLSTSAPIKNAIHLKGCTWGVMSSNTVRTAHGAEVDYEYAIYSESSSLSVIANMYQEGSQGGIGGTGASLQGNDSPAGTFNGTNYKLANL